MKENEETKNTKLVEINKSQGIKAFHTRKREAENYLHSDLFNGEVEIGDYNDVKEEVNKYNNMVSRKKVLEKYWRQMSFDQIRQREIFLDESGKEHYELTEIIQDLLNLI